MDTKPLFFEQQRFRQWWILALLLAPAGLMLYGLITQVFMGITFGDKPMSNEGLTVVAVLQTIFTGLFFTQALFTKIDTNGIYIKFRPYHTKWRFYAWEEIIDCEVKVYSPMKEYGGWGIRSGAYNVSGNVGMLIQFKNRPSLMIGTKKPDEIKDVLRKLDKLKE